MDMNITYEDGLRLSELNGRLTQMQYNLDHIDLTVLPDMICTAAIIGFIIMMVSWGLYALLTERVRGWDSEGKLTYARKHDINPWIWLAGTIVVYIVLCILAHHGLELITVNSIQSDMSNVQAQIDAILSKYGS